MKLNSYQKCTNSTAIIHHAKCCHEHAHTHQYSLGHAICASTFWSPCMVAIQDLCILSASTTSTFTHPSGLFAPQTIAWTLGLCRLALAMMTQQVSENTSCMLHKWARTCADLWENCSDKWGYFLTEHSKLYISHITDRIGWIWASTANERAAEVTCSVFA